MLSSLSAVLSWQCRATSRRSEERRVGSEWSSDVCSSDLHEVRRLEKTAVIIVRHETDFHALLLVGGLELAVPRHFARVALGLFTERKNHARELILPQREKEIALILPQIASALEKITPRSSRREEALTSCAGVRMSLLTSAA